MYRSRKNKDGQPLKTKDGREYERITIKTEEHGDKWISGFGGNWNDNWNEGDTVNAKVEQKGEYLNFSKEDPMESILARIEKLEQAVFTKTTNVDVPATDVPEDDVPF